MGWYKLYLWAEDRRTQVEKDFARRLVAPCVVVANAQRMGQGEHSDHLGSAPVLLAAMRDFVEAMR